MMRGRSLLVTPISRSAAEVIASSCPGPVIENYVTVRPGGTLGPAPLPGQVGFRFLKFDNYHH